MDKIDELINEYGVDDVVNNHTPDEEPMWYLIDQDRDAVVLSTHDSLMDLDEFNKAGVTPAEVVAVIHKDGSVFPRIPGSAS